MLRSASGLCRQQHKQNDRPDHQLVNSQDGIWKSSAIRCGV